MNQTISLPYRVLGKFLRFGFHLLYNEFAWTYDMVAWAVSLGRWNDWIRTVIPYLEGPNVLELGHGPGHLQRSLLAEPELNVFGIDISTYMGRQAQRRLRRQKLTPALVNGDSRKLPFPSESIQTITATFPTEYFTQDVTLRELWRVLAPGGRLVIAPLAWITGKNAADRFAAKLFEVTGQAPEWQERAIEPFQKAGFTAATEWIEIRRSTVLMIVAEKESSLGRYEER